MQAVTVIEHANRNSDSGKIRTKQPIKQAIRLPRRTVRQVFAVPLSAAVRPSIVGGQASSGEYRQSRDDRPRIEVSAIPSADRNCRHHLFVEDGARLKKLDLPSAACVAVTQRFEARAGDTLTYDYVVLLNSSGGIAPDRPAVRAILVNRWAESAVSLMDRSLDASNDIHQRRAGSRFRESQSFTVPNDGHYELRFITFVDHSQPGSEAHLLVNAVRVLNHSGQEVKRLASLSCVGRVRESTSIESVN